MSRDELSPINCRAIKCRAMKCHGTVQSPPAHLQCESKKSPLRTCGNFSKTVGNFSTKFYIPIMCSYLRQTTNFYSITCNFDEVMPYKRDHPVHIMCAKCPPSAKTHFLTFFSKQLGIFSLNFIRLLSIHIYARMQICVQLS